MDTYDPTISTSADDQGQVFKQSEQGCYAKTLALGRRSLEAHVAVRLRSYRHLRRIRPLFPQHVHPQTQSE
jgi:hypothetical protein